MPAPVSLLTPLFGACAVLAWLIVIGSKSRRPSNGYIPIATLLTWLTASNLMRALIQVFVLREVRAILGPDAPYDGPLRLLYFVEIAVRAAWPFALLGASMLVFLGRRPWISIVGWVAATAILCWLYPEIRRQPQARIEAYVALACWAASALAAWWGHFMRRTDRPSCYVPMSMMLGAQLSVTLVVRFGSYPQDDWTIARVVQGTVYVGLLGYQAWILGERQTS
jgi:hypothetical protein